MQNPNQKNIGVVIGKWVSVCLMIFCLSFLTCINYVLYPSQDQTEVEAFAMNTEDSENNFPPSGPTEEKSGGSGFGFAEEMLHENHPEVNFKATNLFYLHHIAETEKIEIFHPEILLPPPKS